MLLDGLAVLLLMASLVGSVYAGLALWAVRRFAAAQFEPLEAGARPPVTILKPLHGAEPRLAGNLRTFCIQAYPEVQVVFGVRRGDDPAVTIAQDLQNEIERRDRDAASTALVVDPRIHGANGKVSNLINMMEAARHDVLVIADSDMAAPRDYLEIIVPELLATRGGAVTCLYVGQPIDSPWARLGAQFINHEFLPSVLVARMVGADTGCFGATIALERATLAKIGGFARFKDLLADDHAIGAAVRALGRPVKLSKIIVTTTVAERDLKSLIDHELRWARTIRSIAPIGYAGSAVTHPVPLALLGILFGGATIGSVGILTIALAARILVSSAIDRTFGLGPRPWLAPLRDVLSLGILVASFCGARIVWRDHSFQVDETGRLTHER